MTSLQLSYLGDFKSANLTFTVKINGKHPKQNTRKFNPEISF